MKNKREKREGVREIDLVNHMILLVLYVGIYINDVFVYSAYSIIKV